MFLLNLTERNVLGLNPSFTIQNVSIKYNISPFSSFPNSNLQYKMFLLNLETLYRILKDILKFTIQNVSIKSYLP